MGFYSASEVIKRTREALGITQEELSDGICAVENLSRMENGHVKIKPETYRRLMAKMERIPEKIYAVGTGRNMEILEERELFESYMRKQEYDEASEYLDGLEKKIGADVVNRQYIKRARAIQDYFTNKIDNVRLRQELDEALRMTLPEYENMLGSKYPLTEQEMQLLMSLANTYTREREEEQAVQLYEALCQHIGSLDQGVLWIRRAKMTVYSVYGHSLMLFGEYEKAQYYLSQALKEACEDNNGVMVSPTLGKLAMISIKEQKETDQRTLKLVYYLAASRNDKKYMKIIKEGYLDNVSVKIEK